MWDRKELKDRAKIAFRANYWKCVLVAVVLSLVAGGTGTSGPSSIRSNNQLQQYNNQLEQLEDLQQGYGIDLESPNEFGEDNLDELFGLYGDEYDDIDNLPYNLDNLDGDDSLSFGGLLGGGFIAILIVVMLAAFVFAFALTAFLLNPVDVGCRKFFLNNSDGQADLGDMGYAFKSNYMNIVKTCFVRDIKIFLFSLLLYVPGVVKWYEYRMVKYILADNPDMDRKEALAASSDMMYGHKWDAFVWDLTFIGWKLLGVITLGLVGIFYADPYIGAADAELYKAVSGDYGNNIYVKFDQSEVFNESNDPSPVVDIDQPEIIKDNEIQAQDPESNKENDATNNSENV